MKIRNRILVQTLSASLALTLVLGTVFFISFASIRKTVLDHSNELGDSAAEISASALEEQLTEKIDRIAHDVALILDERFSKTGNQTRMSAESAVLPSDFAQMIDSFGVGNSGHLFILNSNGVRIYSSDGAPSGENFLESSNPRLRSLGQSMTLGAMGMTELEIDGLSVYTAYAPIQSIGWSLGIAVSAREISSPALLIEDQIWSMTDNIKMVIDQYIFFIAGFIALMLVFTSVAITLFAFRFTRAIAGPILALNEGFHEVAGGNLEREVTIKTGDELEELAVSFNMMTSRIQKHIKEIARVTAERQRIDTELDVATRIQMSLLPNIFPPFRGRQNEFDLYAQVHPAREVGGDFYDFFFVDDDHFAIIVADVSGKGVPAALFMAITKTLIKNRLQSGEDPASSLEIINRQLCDNNIMDMFVTVWLCVLEISSKRLSCINAGHNPPLLKSGDQDFDFVMSPPDLVLAGMDDTCYHCRDIQMKNGDMLFLYTDGIVEAADEVEDLYGKERLREFLNAHAAEPLREMLNGLRDDIAAFTGEAEQSDDITMLAIRIANTENAAVSAECRSITLEASIDHLDAMTAFIDKQLSAGFCPMKERGQIELAAEEVFVNIAHHGYNDSGGKVTIDSRLERDATELSTSGKTTLTLTFRDGGRAFDPLEHVDPDIDLPLEERELGGLGLLIVKKTMDTIHYSREGEMNSLEFSKSWQKERE